MSTLPERMRSRRGTAEPYSWINIEDLMGALRFRSVNDRLHFVKGQPTGQQLQSIRRLTPGSAQLLTARWMRK
jgi:hypothetical protein